MCSDKIEAARLAAQLHRNNDRNEQTELLVLITPRLVKPLDPDEVPALPTDATRFLPATPGDAARPKP